jgi:cystinosin
MVVENEHVDGPRPDALSVAGREGQLASMRESCKENIWVPCALLLGMVVGACFPSDPKYKGTEFQARISEVLGWTYFFAWSASFYPQVVLNFQRRSVVGLSLDYQMLNAVGFACYFLFNGMLYFSPDVQQEYAQRHDGNSSAVMLNDVVFSGHAFILTCITLSQIVVYYDYPPLDRAGLFLRRLVVSSLLLFLTVAVILAVVILATSERTIDWLTYISILSEAKVVISVVKYCPQVWMNYQRKSTVGWNIHNVLLDFNGGMLSVAQLLWDAWAQSDWGKVSGDPVKLLLGNLSMFFDVIFMSQHYCLYRSARHTSEPRDGGLLSPGTEAVR